MGESTLEKIIRCGPKLPISRFAQGYLQPHSSCIKTSFLSMFTDCILIECNQLPNARHGHGVIHPGMTHQVWAHALSLCILRVALTGPNPFNQEQLAPSTEARPVWAASFFRTLSFTRNREPRSILDPEFHHVIFWPMTRCSW